MTGFTLRQQIGITFALAFIVIATALASEIYGGLIPCALCLKQRVPYYLALPLLTIAFAYAPKGHLAAHGLMRTVGVIFLFGAGLGIYHAGIEYGMWAGPATCGGGGGLANSTEALFKALESNSMVRCDAPAWTLFGISLAGYNAMVSLAIAFIAFRPIAEER